MDSQLHAAALRTGAAFEAMLIAPMLAPLAGDLDAFGEYGIDLLANQIALRDRHGFGALVAARLERSQ